MTLVRRVRTGVALLQMTPAFIAFGLLRHVVPLRMLVRWACARADRPRDVQREQVLVAGAVKLGYVFTVFDRNCLQRSLLLYRMLGKGGARPRLTIGFLRNRDGLRGHAWVTVDGVPVVDAPGDLAGFVPTCSFAADGTMQPEADSAT